MVNEGSPEQCELDENVGWMFWKKRRYIVTFLSFLGFFNVYALRANLSIAIVAMTENKSVKEFDWDSKLQGYILGSFFYGYLLTQILGGWLAMKIGGKTLFGIGIAFTALMTILTPFATRINVYLLIVLRVIEGIFEGIVYPSMHAMWSNWAPPLERSRLTAFASSGAYVGTVVSMPVCAFLANNLGWSSIFYVFGIIGLIWYLFWCLLISEQPVNDSSITKHELEYITKSLEVPDDGEKVIQHPWGSIFKSVPVWACIIMHISGNWGFYTSLTQLPKYMNDILDFDLEQTGFMSALPYLLMSLILPISGSLADFFLVRNLLNITQVRKLYNSGSSIVQAIFMLWAVYTDSLKIALISLVLATSLGAFSCGSFCVNYLDLAPKHAGILMGLGNTFGTLPGILSPILSGYIVTTPTKNEWQIVFFITAGIHIFGGIFYWIFGSGEVQSWASHESNDNNGIENSSYQHTDP